MLVAIFQQTKRRLHAGHPARSGTIVWLRAARTAHREASHRRRQSFFHSRCVPADAGAARGGSPASSLAEIAVAPYWASNTGTGPRTSDTFATATAGYGYPTVRELDRKDRRSG